MREEITFCKNSANRSILSALLVAIVCFGSGRWVRDFVEIQKLATVQLNLWKGYKYYFQRLFLSSIIVCPVLFLGNFGMQ